MRGLGVLFFFVACTFLMWPACGEAAYPTKPINFIIPYGTGGASDLGGRSFAMAATKYLGQPVMVSNRPGASGTTGSFEALRARPDGYTLLLSRVSSQGMYPAQKIPNKLYEWDSFTILTIIEINPYVVTVLADSPYKTLNELANAIKQNPGKLKFSHSGVGTPLYLGPQMLAIAAGGKATDVVGVPFSSDGDSKLALLGGQVDFLLCNLAGVIDQIQAGRLRTLAACTKERLPEIPDVPTAGEAGFSDLAYLAGWSGFYGPKNLPKEVVDKWVSVIKQIAKDEEWLARCKQLGAMPMMTSPEESEAFVKKQVELFRSIYATME